MEHAIARCVVATLLALPIAAQEFRVPCPTGVERVFPGPDLHGNRLFDWRVADGRFECTEGRKAKPMRTLALLTHGYPEGGSLEMQVRTGPIGASEPRHRDTWTGFLIGVGGPHVDYRVSALCHHWPATDGGLIAALDGEGHLVFRDNGHDRGPKGPRANIQVTAWPLEPDTRHADDRLVHNAAAMDVVLRLRAEPTDDQYTLTLSASSPATGDVLATATLPGVDRDRVEGAVALVSHRSAELEGPGYWFRDWTLGGDGLRHHPDRAFGPIVSTQYTLSRGVLKMTAQMAPVGSDEAPTVQLQVREGDTWRTVSTAAIATHSNTAVFRVPEWDARRETPYRVRYELRTDGETAQEYTWSGTVRRDPVGEERLRVAGFTGHHISAKGDRDWNGGSIWYPHDELVRAVAHHDPDLLFFSGDQIYEGGLAGIVRNPPEVACLDYLYHWYRWCWAFRDLTRDRPCIAIPDDHDVYHGNIWGAGGIAAKPGKRYATDASGYLMDPLFVNAVHRTQVGNLPAPFDGTPIEQGISVYHTDLVYGGVSFAVIADRMWKSSPTVMVPEGDVVNGWFQNTEFDPRDADVEGAVLLGDRQLAFLDHWAADWSGGAQMKALLSQTIFANVATIPAEATGDSVVPGMRQADPGEYIRGDKMAADADSNGWPQSGRDLALRSIRRGFAFHLAGDQHLGSFVHYGVDEFGDAGYAFCVPSIANVWPRRWFPPEPGANRAPNSPAYTGDFFDGFGNRITVHAVSNPRNLGVEPTALHDRAPGYGIVDFDKTNRTVTAHCWPRWQDPRLEGAEQYPGWPITVRQVDHFAPSGTRTVPVEVTGVERPVVQVRRGDEVVFTIRMPTPEFALPLPGPGPFVVEVSEPDDGRRAIRTDVGPATAGPLRFEL